MNTPPMAGVWMKYANMNCEIDPPCVPMTAAVLAIVISNGTHNALVWMAIQGSAARSGRTWIGRIDARNASVKPIRPPGTDVLSPGAALPAVELVDRPLVVGDVASSIVSAAGSMAVAARLRRRASARSVLLARATVSPG